MNKQLLYIILLLFFFSRNAYCQQTQLKEKELYSSDFIIDGYTRPFTYYMPQHYGEKLKYPLLIFLHDINKTGRQLIKNYGDIIHSKADSASAIIIYPDAVDGRWNVTDDTAHKGSSPVNDVSFLSIIIDYFVQQHNADEKRIYVAGINNGAAMAYRLSCSHPLKIAAIAPLDLRHDYAEAICKNATPVAVMDTKKLLPQTPFKFDQTSVDEIFSFFMAHPKK